MTEDTIKTRELPVVSDAASVNLSDKLISSHYVDESARATVGISVETLAERFCHDDIISKVASKNIFGEDLPDPDIGVNGDCYYRIQNGLVTASYVKYNGEWIFNSADNWSRYLPGEPFDCISYGALLVRSGIFQGDTALQNVVLPNCITINQNAFKESGVTSLRLDSIESIGESAFESCQYLRGDIDLTKCITIGANAFNSVNGQTPGQSNNCKVGLEDVVTIGYRAFFNACVFQHVKSGGSAIELYLPHCTTIADGAFSATAGDATKTAFTDIILPAIEQLTVSDYGQHFRGVILQGELPDHKRVMFGPNMTNAGRNPFYDTPIAYYDFYIEATTPPSLTDGLNVVSGSSMMPHAIYVPADSVSAYKSHSVWGQYSDYISALPEGYVSITEREV